MNPSDIEKILLENKKLKEENDELKEKIEKLELKLNNIPNNHKSDKIVKLMDEPTITKNNKNLEKNFDSSFSKELDNENMDSMSVISFLARSKKRVQILKSISQTPKIPSIIGKEIGDSSHHVSKYLTSLKNRDLVVCLNEEDKRFRFYNITAKGKYYLEIIENKKY